MAEYERASEVKIVQAVAPQIAWNGTTPLTGISIDTLGFESVTFHSFHGDLSGGSADIKLQEADDNGAGSPGAFTDVSADDALAYGVYPFVQVATPGEDDGSKTILGYRGKKRWVRMVVTEATAITAWDYCAVAELGHAKIVPQA